MTKKPALNNLELNLGKLYFVRNTVQGSSGGHFLKSVLAKSLSNYFREDPTFEDKSWKSYEVERYISLDSELILPNIDFPVFDIEASISVLNKKTSLREKLGLNDLVRAVYQKDSKKYCELDEVELEQFNLREQIEAIRNENPAILAIGYEIQNSKIAAEPVSPAKKSTKKTSREGDDQVSSRILWEFREARSYGIKRFLFDDQYVQISNEIEPDNLSLELDLANTTKEEKELLQGVRKMTVILRAISISNLDLEGIELEIKNLYSDSIFKSRDEKVLLTLEKKQKSFSLKTKIPLEGSYICPSCKTIFPTLIDSVLPVGIIELFAGFTESELTNFETAKLLKTLIKSSFKADVEKLSRLIFGSIFENRLDEEVGNLSYFEQIHFFIFFLSVTEIEETIFILNSTQDPFETDQGKDILKLMSGCLKNRLSFLVLTKASINSEFAAIEIGECESQQEVGICKKTSEPRDGTFDAKKFKAALSKSVELDVVGNIGKGKTTLLKNFATFAHEFKSGKAKETREYFAIENGLIKYVSKKPKENFKAFKNLLSSTSELLEIDEFFIELYSSTLSAKRLALFKDDFGKDRPKTRTCLTCGGMGFIAHKFELGYQGMKCCLECNSTGLSKEFQDISFFNTNYIELHMLSFGEVISMFEGEPRLNDIGKFAAILNASGVDLVSQRFAKRLFELTNQEKIGLLLLNLSLQKDENVTYVVEHPFDLTFCLGASDEKTPHVELLAEINTRLSQLNSKILISSYENTGLTTFPSSN